jgi:type III secretory pathway component EscT
MDLPEVERPLGVLFVLALRVVPSFFWLGWPLRSAGLAFALGLGAAISLWPLALRITPDLQLSAAGAGRELARGVVLGLGGLLPLFALGWGGRIADAIRDPSPLEAGPSILERLYVSAAIAVLFASGGHTLVWSALTGSLVDVPLGGGQGDPSAIATIALELSRLLARAFELGVVLAAPVVLVTVTGALLVGLTARVSPLLGAALLRGPLLPAIGLSAACLSISGILGEYPQVAQVFIDATRALVSGLR